jgi:hypothetical protein
VTGDLQYGFVEQFINNEWVCSYGLLQGEDVFKKNLFTGDSGGLQTFKSPSSGNSGSRAPQ